MPGEGRARTGAERVEESGTQRQRDSPQRVRGSCRAASFEGRRQKLKRQVPETTISLNGPEAAA